MSLQSVRAFFAEKAPDITVVESPISSATVPLAAEAYGVEPGRIAKTLSLRIGERVILLVAAGTSRMDNKKVKAAFGGKPKMLGLHLVPGLEHCAAAARQLRRILLQAGHNTIHIRNLVATQSPHIRRASHLLFHSAAIFLGIGRALRNHASDRKRHTERNPLCSHIQILLDSPRILFNQ